METMGAVNLKPDKARKPNGKAWWVVLGVLLAVIVALVVAVVVVNVSKKGSGVDDGDDDVVTEEEVEQMVEEAEDAGAVSDEIIKSLEAEEITLDEAVSRFEEELPKGDINRRTHMAIRYAQFVYKYFMDEDGAVEILLEIEPEIENSDLKIELYRTIRDIYEDSGEQMQADEYSIRIEEMSPIIEIDISDMLESESE